MIPKAELGVQADAPEEENPGDQLLRGQLPLPGVTEIGHEYELLNDVPILYATGISIIQDSEPEPDKIIYRAALPKDGQYYFRHPSHPNQEVIVKRYSARLLKEFEHELQALKLLSTLKSPRIMACLASYRVGEEYYMTLPMARCTLDEYWANVEGQPDFETHKTWILCEISALMTTLASIHSLPLEGIADLSPEEPGLMHGDIQPPNILVTDSNTLIFTDFELSAWAGHPAPYKSTRSFEAPEAELCTMRETKSSDIWSMGCVILECLVWLFKGKKAVDAFREARVTGIPGYSTVWKDDFFFLLRYEDGEIRGAEVKEQVMTCADALSADDRCDDSVRSLIDMVMGSMIVVDQEARETARELAVELSTIL